MYKKVNLKSRFSIITLTLFLFSCSPFHNNLETSKIKKAKIKNVNFNNPNINYLAVREINEPIALKVSGNIYLAVRIKEGFEIKLDSFSKQLSQGDVFTHKYDFKKYDLLEYENDQNFGLVNSNIETFRTYVKYNNKIRFGEIINNEMIDLDYFPADKSSFNLKKLMFRGLKNDTLKISYHHYNKQYHTPDKLEHYKFDISKVKIITCKGLKIKILEIDNKKIKYMILDNSVVDNVFDI